jgi:hypothetical protein
MKHYDEQWIQEWCDNNGWTDLVVDRHHSYWAFPPNAVMPEPLPMKALKTIKLDKGMTFEEKLWAGISFIFTLISATVSYVLKCPMPIFLAFAFCAVTVAKLEIEH